MSHLFPDSFWQTLPSNWQDQREQIVRAHDDQAQTSIRLHPRKPSSAFADAPLVPWTKLGRYIHQRPFFAADPLWHAGAYYVQEPSSMFLEQALTQWVDINTPHTVLDLCAAPGGKSTHAASLFSTDSLIISNEVIQSRVGVLAANMSTWGQDNTWVSNNDPLAFGRLGPCFDVILVDAPCSGSGLFRKMPQYINDWNPDLVDQCAARQQRILHDAYDALAKDGILVYMTCSMSVAENEAIVDALLQTHALESLSIACDSTWGIEETRSERGGYGYRLSPHLLQGEGFFLAVFRKLDGEPLFTPIPNPKMKSLPFNLVNDYYANESVYVWEQSEKLLMIQEAHKPWLDYFASRLKLIKKGIAVGKRMREDIIPDHELALAINGSFAKCWDLSLADAQRFLLRETPEQIPETKGWHLITYQHMPIGWCKQVGNRINNYYPMERRILHKSILENEASA